jgi:hypothetical protein
MTTVLAGDPILAADINRALTRVIGTPTIQTAAGTAITSTTDTQIDSLTVTVEAGRRYKLIARVPWLGSVANDNFYIFLRETSATGTQLTFRNARVTQTTRVDMTDLWTYWTAASSGSMTFVSSGRRSDGSGNLTPQGATNGPRTLTLEAAD